MDELNKWGRDEVIRNKSGEEVDIINWNWDSDLMNVRMVVGKDKGRKWREKKKSSVDEYEIWNDYVNRIGGNVISGMVMGIIRWENIKERGE